MKNKSNWTSRAKTSWGFKRFKPKGETKAVEGKHWISKEIYDKTLEEKMDEILEMSREINYNNLVYDFTGSTPSISFAKFGGSMYTYNWLKMVT